MRPAYEVELLKLRRSRVPQVAGLALVAGPPLLAAAFTAAAARGGADPMSLKAQAMAMGAGWQGYLGGLIQIFATGGLLGFGVVVAWCFGREYADRTVVSLYASATGRGEVAAAKLVVVLGWTVLISVLLAPASLLVGLGFGLGAPDAADLADVGRLMVLGVLTGLLALAVALFASLGRGYLAGFGGLLALVVAAQVAVVTGAGGWFPYSAPGLWAAGSSVGLPAVPAAQLGVVPLAALLLAWATVAWWHRAELA